MAIRRDKPRRLEERLRLHGEAVDTCSRTPSPSPPWIRTVGIEVPRSVEK
jgi:hypothetical protein